MKRPQLFLLHFAGGNCYSFQAMIPLLGDFQVVPLELPGRGRRIHEHLLKDYDLAALDFYNQIMEQLNTPHFVIYGHSMGAYLALTVSDMLEKAGKPPLFLCVSGNPGPGITLDKKRYLMDHDEFVDELRKIGGVPEEVLVDKDLFDFFEPILRADFEIVEKQEIKVASAISVRLCALMGSREQNVDKIMNWSRFTHADFKYEILEGGHFFIYDHLPRIAHNIRQAL